MTHMEIFNATSAELHNRLNLLIKVYGDLFDGEIILIRRVDYAS